MGYTGKSNGSDDKTIANLNAVSREDEIRCILLNSKSSAAEELSNKRSDILQSWILKSHWRTSSLSVSGMISETVQNRGDVFVCVSY